MPKVKSTNIPGLRLTFEGNETYEVGAALLAVLARPECDDKYNELHASLCARAARERYDSNPDQSAPICIKPQYAFRDVRTINRESRYVSNRIGERLVAGRMMAHFLIRTTPIFEELPPSLNPLSINRLAAHVQDDAGQSDTTNVKNRFWRRGRSVVHLAASIYFTAKDAGLVGEEFTFDRLLHDREAIEIVIKLANTFEEVIQKNPGMPVKVEDLVKITLE